MAALGLGPATRKADVEKKWDRFEGRNGGSASKIGHSLKFPALPVSALSGVFCRKQRLIFKVTVPLRSRLWTRAKPSNCCGPIPTELDYTDALLSK